MIFANLRSPMPKTSAEPSTWPDFPERFASDREFANLVPGRQIEQRSFACDSG
jgi:hypothetical protein